jgi:hypothetical protein
VQAAARLVNRPPPVIPAAAVRAPEVRHAASGVQCLGMRVSAPSDPAEAEARRVARSVVSMPTPAAARISRSPVLPQRAEVAPTRPQAPSLPGGGRALPEELRQDMEPRFQADFSRVRIHTDESAARASRQVQAQAFTVGERIYFAGGQFRPETGEGRELIAHELTHTIQQGAAPQAIQRMPETAVLEHSGEQAQRWDLPDPRRLIADRAAAIPGFTMLTVIIGRNPITGSAVDRSAGNLLRGAIELMPGGVLVTQALANHGIFDRVSAWVEPRFAALRDLGASLIESIRRFIADLGVGDLLDPVGVWNRARNLVSGIIDRVLSFARNLASGILDLIRDAVLRPLAGLAAGTRGWDLLCAVLGRNPITGEAVPRTAATLIGGFMRLIGQEEVWQNIQRGNAIGRAWAWFQGAMAGLMGFVGALPGLFLATLRSLGINDLLTPIQTFTRIVRVFGDFAGRFIGWAGAQVMSLLEIIFEVVAPAVIPYLRRAAGAMRTIIANPVRFIGNLVRAAVQGFRQFASNILTHLRASLIGWLTGAMAGANIYIPQAFTLQEIIKFVLSVLGLTWQNIRGKLVRVAGEPVVAAMETGFDIVVTLVRDGPAAAWERIRESLANLREMAIEQIMSFVRDNIVTAAITRLVSMLNPAGAFIQAIIAIYNTVMFFVERLRQIAQVAAAFVDSIAAIASGVITAAASRVEQTMAGLLTLVISFLARLVGLGRVSDAITNIISRIRAPIDRALDRVVEWLVTVGRRFLSRDPSPASAVRGPVAAALARELRAEHTLAQAEAIVQRVATQFRGQGIRRLSLAPPDADGAVQILAETNPTAPLALLRPQGVVPRGRSVRANIELTLGPGEPAILPRRAGATMPLGATADGARSSTGANPRSFNELGAAHEGATTRSRGGRSIGGIVLEPAGNRVQLITWNTGSLNPDTLGNQTHAERQFDHWVDQVDAVPEGRAFLHRVTRVDMHLRDYSPCGTCCSMLRATRRKFPNASSANLHWYQLYTGRADPTRWHNLGDLRDWQLHAPGSAMPVEGNQNGVRVTLVDLPR